MARDARDVKARVRWCLHAALIAAWVGSALPAGSDEERTPARAVLEAALAALGGPCPPSLSLSGSLSATLGSTVTSGRVRVLIGGARQSKEDIAVESGRSTLVAVDERATETVDGRREELPRERALSAPTTVSPAVWLERALADPYAVIEFVATEPLDGENAQRIRVWTAFPGTADADLGPMSRRDFWISTTSRLPLRLVFEEYGGRGAEPGVAVEVRYANYASAGTRLHPMTVERWLNGTPWQQIQIESVSDASIPASEFSLEQGEGNP